ncbi:hypothetical protein N7475_005369 [Penicillium sp. IBT 31633x]|nr:hypothetical protein N7475_005369 [Penicillium sp. IBT 31633x]
MSHVVRRKLSAGLERAVPLRFRRVFASFVATPIPPVSLNNCFRITTVAAHLPLQFATIINTSPHTPAHLPLRSRYSH